MVATSQIAQTTLRSVLGQHTLDELLSEREKINEILQRIIDETTGPWGIKVSIVEVKDVEIPAGMQKAMARQAEAERERRAKIINSEGEFQAAEKLKDAAIVLEEHPIAVQLRYLQTLIEISGTTDRRRSSSPRRSTSSSPSSRSTLPRHSGRRLRQREARLSRRLSRFPARAEGARRRGRQAHTRPGRPRSSRP